MATQTETQPQSDPLAGYSAPLATIDVALFTVRSGGLQVLLLRREADPFQGELALPGGFVHAQEDVDTADTARRVLREKIGLESGYLLEQLYTFSGRVRDPRGWSLSVVYYAVVPASALPSDRALTWVPVENLPALPFDHERIVAKALERLRGKAAYSSLPAFLLPPIFTLGELHEVYQQVMGTRLDLASFRRKIQDQEIVEPIKGQFRQGGSHRPSQLYRLTATTLREFDRTI